jgi:serine/threonine protein kinase
MSISPRSLGKYELKERLGRGGMAEVWKSYDTQLQRYVAIKFLQSGLHKDTDFANRFIREAQTIAALRHPNIVQVHDFQAAASSEHGGSIAYMVMNYIEGPTLAEYILTTSRVGKFPLSAEIVHLFTTIGGAIDYAHQNGMVHRDIKPANIMLNKKLPSRYQMGEPILTDFGIVKLLGATSGTVNLDITTGILNAGPSVTLSGALIGTPLYMAPEQARSQPGDERSDIYSLGVILYEICTGVVPFHGSTPSAIIMQHVFAEPPNPVLLNPNISPELSKVILRCLAKDPAARFSNASDLSSAIAQSLIVTPSGGISATSSSGERGQGRSLVSTEPRSSGSTSNGLSPIPPLTPTYPQGAHRSMKKNKRKRMMLIMVIPLLLLVLVGAGLGTFSLLQHKYPGSTAGQIVGDVFFVSSGHLEKSDSQGIEDEVQIDLHGIPDPAPGNEYYAWLLDSNAQNLTRAIPLGSLTIDQGKVSVLHKHDQQYTNLLAKSSGFLITEENANQIHPAPSSDRHTWRYSAHFPQTPSTSVSHYSVLDYLRDLLYVYEGHFVPSPGVRYALAIQFLRNVYQVFLAAKSARDNWDSKNVPAIHGQVVSILDYLDSSTLVKQDVPSGTQVLVDPALVELPLLDFSTEQSVAGYFSRFEEELQGLIDTPQVTSSMQMLAQSALTTLPTVQNWLNAVHTDAAHLAGLSNAQLLSDSTRSILDDMEVQAGYAFNGQGNPASSQFQAGALWVVTNQIQRLATLEVRAV